AKALLQAVKNFISAIHPISETATEAFVNCLIAYKFLKKSTIAEPETPAPILYFITKGAVREYIINDKGNDISVWFGFENDVAVCLASFISNRPSYTGLQALEDVQTFGIHRDSLYKLYDDFPEIERLGRLMTERYFVATEAYRRGFHHLSAAQRYDELISNSPEIIQRIPLTHISSYLGVSLETLSRIRAKLT
ncbi:MAG: Crp/Fnr family transcriptional regulator, partial [Spirosomaceae bacterium]|nr:Crp/Fnr family transcriptional regulator [Spirosomataceae bacterium]